MQHRRLNLTNPPPPPSTVAWSLLQPPPHRPGPEDFVSPEARARQFQPALTGASERYRLGNGRHVNGHPDTPHHRDPDVAAWLASNREGVFLSAPTTNSRAGIAALAAARPLPGIDEEDRQQPLPGRMAISAIVGDATEGADFNSYLQSTAAVTEGEDERGHHETASGSEESHYAYCDGQVNSTIAKTLAEVGASHLDANRPMGVSWLFNDTTTCRQAPPAGLVLLWTAIVEAHEGVVTNHQFTTARLSAGNRMFATSVNTKTQATWLMLKKYKKLEAKNNLVKGIWNCVCKNKDALAQFPGSVLQKGLPACLDFIRTLLTKHFKLFSEKAAKTFKSPEETANLFEGAMHGRQDCAQYYLLWMRIVPKIIETANAIAEGQEQQEEIADASRKHVDGVQRKQLDFIKRMSFDKEIPSTSRAAVRLQKKQKPNPKKPILNLQHDGSSCSEDGTS